uniref:Malic enzyme NAD-binding domain-containing protein n=1 Tax=Timema genevievae TaxID=629358 RepID=A0A7R9PIX2_TIMGE|nr:unnamed protein product [Timema genevievae]
MVNRLYMSTPTGCSNVGGAFTPSILGAMASFHQRPLVFALSTPSECAECDADNALRHTNTKHHGNPQTGAGKKLTALADYSRKLNSYVWHKVTLDGKGCCLFGSGAPDVTKNLDEGDAQGSTGSTLMSHAYVSPGITLGVLCTKMHHVADDIFIIAAQTIANMVTEEDLEQGRIYPPLENSRQVSLAIATAISQYAYDKGRANTYPEPEDKMAYILDKQYDYNYHNALPAIYSWPSHATKALNTSGLQVKDEREILGRKEKCYQKSTKTIVFEPCGPTAIDTFSLTEAITLRSDFHINP